MWLDLKGTWQPLLRRSPRYERLAQNIKRVVAAVERPKDAAPDFPPLRSAHELPPVGAHAVDAIALGHAMRRDLHRLGQRIRTDDLQVGRGDGAVTIELDMRQAAEVSKSAADGLLVRWPLRHLGDGVVAGRGLAAAKIKDAVIGEDRANVGLRTGIGAWRMAGDEVVDREPVLDRFDPILDRALLGLRHAFLPGPTLAVPVMLPCRSRRCQGGERRWRSDQPSFPFMSLPAANAASADPSE